MIWTKGAHQIAKVQTFVCSHKISPKSSLYWNYIKFWLKSAEELRLMTLKIDAKYKEKLICSKMTRIWWNLTRALEFPKHSIFHDTEEWCKIWRKTDFWFGKWQEYGKFSPEHLKVLILGFWWDPIIQSKA